MAVSLAQIRAGLVANLRAAYPQTTGQPNWNIQPYFLSNMPTPAIALRADPIMYDKAMRGGLDEVHFCIYAWVGAGIDQSVQELLDNLMDPRTATSMKKAIEVLDNAPANNKATLGGLVQQVVVTECAGQKEYETAGGGFAVGTEFQVMVWP